MDWERLDEATIRQRLTQAKAYPPDDPYPPGLLRTPPRPAAVLIPFVRHQERWHLLFIHRAENPHDPHSGQVSFPGGRSEDGERPPETALRETEEELGISPRMVRLLGEMPHQRTISNYWITPLVGVLSWPVPLQPAAAEVTRVFLIPLAWLADPANREIRLRETPAGLPPFPIVYYRPYQGEIIWGATARMVLRLLDILRGQGQRPTLAPFQN
ncbi:MAG TPA: CoA pyrophosphatase [Anaerolineae bacterium]|nr:CoA pyrophosphatase [Anaerolineae bacterium]HID83524.1 CoA pyrophosphatase [Anaerolineales bacterium]HIQ08805.1 CoA pyrophosphatase [Anaerolineaceae bacterium]